MLFQNVFSAPRSMLPFRTQSHLTIVPHDAQCNAHWRQPKPTGSLRESVLQLKESNINFSLSLLAKLLRSPNANLAGYFIWNALSHHCVLLMDGRCARNIFATHSHVCRAVWRYEFCACVFAAAWKLAKASVCAFFRSLCLNRYEPMNDEFNGDLALYLAEIC